MGGFFDNTYATYISIQLNKCANTTTKVCKTPSEIEKYLDSKHLQFSMYYEKVNFFPTNYSFPLQDYITVDSFNIDHDMNKRQHYFFQELTIATDQGLMIESFNNQTKQQFANKMYRVSNRELDQNCFVELKFFTSDEGIVLTRLHMKVQDILAQLATIFNIIFIIFDKFTHFFYNKKMEEIIMRRIFQICNDDLDEKPNLKQIELSQNPEKNKNFSIVFLNKSQNDISDEKSSSDVLEQKNLNEIKDIKILNDKSPNNVVSLFQNNNKGRKLFEFMYKERIIDKGKEFKIRLLQFIIYSICP